MVLDTDTYNEIDDQFAVSYAMLSPETMRIHAVYAAPFHNERSSSAGDGMEKSYEEILRILGRLKKNTEGFAFRGSKTFMPGAGQPVDSPAARDLIKKANAPRGGPLYVITLAPTTAFWDTSEYIATAHILGIPHPPGNPVFVLIARAWELLLTPTALSVAVRINLFSAFMGAATAFFWFLLVHRILAYFSASEIVRRVGAGAAVLVSATAFTVWNQSNVNEKVYSISLFTIALLSWTAFLWREKVEAHRSLSAARASRFHDDNALVFGIFVLALSVGNHLMALLVMPAVVVYVTWVAWPLYRGYVLSLLVGALGVRSDEVRGDEILGRKLQHG